MKKRLFVMLLTVVMICATLPLHVFAADVPVPHIQSCLQPGCGGSIISTREATGAEQYSGLEVCSYDKTRNCPVYLVQYRLFRVCTTCGYEYGTTGYTEVPVQRHNH